MPNDFEKQQPAEIPHNPFNTSSGLTHDYANNLLILEMRIASFDESSQEATKKFHELEILKYSQENPASRFPGAYNDKTRPIIEELDGLTEKLNLAVKREKIEVAELEDIYNRMSELIFGNDRFHYVDWTGRGLHKPKPQPKKPRII
ncbi:MAG: hypothetical protein V4467_03845 [Patescibacteria group bacterium]